jgi:hypothetical protein
MKPQYLDLISMHGLLLCALATQDALDKPAAGWDGAGGGFPTPFHVFVHHYKDANGPMLHKWEHYLEPYHKHLDR